MKNNKNLQVIKQAFLLMVLIISIVLSFGNKANAVPCTNDSKDCKRMCIVYIRTQYVQATPWLLSTCKKPDAIVPAVAGTCGSEWTWDIMEPWKGCFIYVGGIGTKASNLCI